MLTGKYLGQEVPGLEPEIFAPGIVSNHRGVCRNAAPSFRLFISFLKSAGDWTEATDMSEILKSAGGINARISPDGKYVFFVGSESQAYWIDAGIIEKLKPKLK